MAKNKFLLFIILSLTIIGYSLYQPYSNINDNICKDCNVIVVSIDTLRADHMGCYGYARNTTPFLDSLSKKSIFFKNAYTPWPKTAPAFASFFTGLNPYNTGVERITLPQHVDDKLVLLPEILKEKGYEVRGVSGNPIMNRLTNMAQGFNDYTIMNKDASHINKKAINDIRAIKDKKFFYWIHYMDPHWPYNPPVTNNDFYNDEYYLENDRIPRCKKDGLINKIKKSYNKDFTDAYTKKLYSKTVDLDYQCFRGGDHLSNKTVKYDSEILFADNHVRAIFDELEDLGIMEKTIIVFLSDHGESLGDHDYYFDHGRLSYNACLKVPLMVLKPGLKPRVIESAVSLTDMFPTLLAFLGIEYDGIIDGEDISFLLDTPDVKRVLFSSAGYALNYQKIYYDGRWKLIVVPDKIDILFYNNQSMLLFDTESDPKEHNNLFGEDVEGMYLLQYHMDVQENHFKDDPEIPEIKEYELGEKQRKILKELGYLS